jgi:hypothetical protein
MRRSTSLAILLVALWLTAGDGARAQAPKARLPEGGDAALACGQTPNGRAYWVEYGFCDIPVRGPAGAKGLILWSHGVSGDREQYRGATPPIMRRLAGAGWDIVRINRNNLNERGWTSSGVRHRDDAIARVRSAKAQGYRYVVLAGQSYGGAISLEANARAGEIDAVVALSPGHGSDLGQAGGGGGGRYFNTDTYLLDAVSAQKGGRIVVLVAMGDQLHPNRSAPGSHMGPRLRQALAGTGRPYLVFDETGPIHGHGAGTTNQFSEWFGACVVRFLDPTQPVNAGETLCPAPNPVPRFLLPANLKRPTPGASGPARWLGAWEGSYASTKEDLMVVVESLDAGKATIVYASGAGPDLDRSMNYTRYTKGRLEGDRIVVERTSGSVLELAMSSDGQRVDIVNRSASQTLSGTLSRGR